MIIFLVRWYFRTNNPMKYLLVPFWLWVELLQIPYEKLDKKGKKQLGAVYSILHGFLIWLLLYFIINYLSGQRLEQLLFHQ